jgi:hypothetical protein
VTVTQQTLAIARSPEQNLIVVTTAPGSPSEEALALLRQACGPTGEVARPARPAARPPAGRAEAVAGGSGVGKVAVSGC